jgi:indolepyruvate ferredoxin oxidoreductase, alpha subunit
MKAGGKLARDKVLLSGNEAMARGAWEAGVDFGSGYPGTPSSEILPALAELGVGHVEWSVNEKCALEAAVGASLAGARALVTMKHVGLNVAADPFFTLAYTGVKGGLVVVSADDPDMQSSQNEHDSRHYARAAQVPMLEPADSQEAADFVRQAYELSEEYDLPVLLRATTRVCHSHTPVSFGPRENITRGYELVKEPEKYVMIPGYARKRNALRLEHWHELMALAETTEFNRVEKGDERLGIVCSGVAYQYAKEVVPEASFFKIGMTWPLPRARLHEFAAGVERLVVVEESGPFLAHALRALGLSVEHSPATLALGELSPGRVAGAIVGEERQGPRGDSDLPPRPPVLCPGCPHRAVFVALRKLKCFVTGDIGCYTLGTLPPLSALHTCLCMGAGIGQAHGINTVFGETRSVAVIGDSTFIHSGITGLINIAYNGSKSVVVILDNATTAMTGGQEHPATGRTLSGKPARKLSLEGLCRAAGIDNVVVVDPVNLANVETALQEALASDGPAVVIARRPCVLLSRERSAPYSIDAEVCVECGQCLGLGCPAISSEDGRPVIDAGLCTGCGLCAQVCPTDAITQDDE